MADNKPTVDFEELTRMINAQNDNANARNSNAQEEARLDAMNRAAQETASATIERNRQRFANEQQKKSERERQRQLDEAAENEKKREEEERRKEKRVGFMSTIKTMLTPKPTEKPVRPVNEEKERLREMKAKEKQVARQHRLDQKKLDREQKENEKKIAAEEKKLREAHANVPTFHEADLRNPTKEIDPVEPIKTEDPLNDETPRIIPPELQALKDNILQTETVTDGDLESLLPMLDRDDLLAVAMADRDMDTLLIISADALKEILPTMHIECAFVYLLTVCDAIYVGTHGTSFREMTNIMNDLREALCKTRWRLTPETVAMVPDLLIFNHVKGGC